MACWPATEQTLAATANESSMAGPAASPAALQQGSDAGAAAAAAAFWRLAERSQQWDEAAARVFVLLGAELHSQLLAHGSNCGAALWPAIAEAAAAAGEAAMPWLVTEAAALRCVVAVAAGDEVAQASAMEQLVGCSGLLRSPLLWPPAAQPEGQGTEQRLWVDPMALAVLSPPAAGHAVAPPAELLAQLPLRQQAALLDQLLPTCSPAAAEAAVAVAEWACTAAADIGQAGSQQSLWRHPLLSWALPAAATALLSSIPQANPHLWHQVRISAACTYGWAGSAVLPLVPQHLPTFNALIIDVADCGHGRTRLSTRRCASMRLSARHLHMAAACSISHLHIFM